MNYCATCGLDFASLRAFDAHRVGKHAYTYSEGLKLDPPREDGRHCLHETEMREHGFSKDTRGRWVDPRSRRNRARKGGYRAAVVHGGSRAMPNSSGQHEGAGATR